MNPSPSIMHKVIAAFEVSAERRTSLDGQTLRGFPRWHTPRLFGDDRDAIIEHYITAVGYDSNYVSYFGDDEVDVDLEEDESPGWLCYRNPETYRLKRLPKEEVQILQVNTPRFLHEVADLLNIPQADRKGIDQPLIDHVLWKLGSATLWNGYRTPILVARSLPIHLDQILSVLTHHPGALVLST